MQFVHAKAVLAIPFMLAVSACGGDSASTPQAPSGNASPRAVATVSSPSAYSTQIVKLDGNASSDSDGQINSYQWTQIAGPAISIASPDSAIAEFSVPRLEQAAEVRVQLQVLDEDGASGSTQVSIQITPAPVQFAVDLSGSIPFTESAPVTLRVKSATLNGIDVVPVRLEWESSIQGSLTGAVAIDQAVDVTMNYGDHVLTLVGDFGDLGVARYTEDVKVLPRTLEVSTYLSTPAAGYTKLVPVVLVTHIPTRDGSTLDLAEANYPFRPPEWRNNSVADLIAYIETINIRKKFILEEMSRFRGYKLPENAPYLGYKVVAHYIFYEALPLDSRTNPFDPNQQMVDFTALMNKIDGQTWVDTESVQEFWFNNYFNEKFQFWESNMSSPTTGDISNSDQFPGDLPVYSSTYVIYGTNYHRTQAEAVHNHGHQIERMLDYVDRLHSRSSDLFWGSFVGGLPPSVPGRCGWTHQPPNTTIDYGYSDMTIVNVDCEDWRPDGLGTKVPVNSAYFDTLSYAWPDGKINIPQRAETQFYIWWGQNMPGNNNQIPYGSTTMENWWRIIGDWDFAITNSIKLYE